MSIKAYGFNLRSEDYNVICGLIKKFFSKPIQIYDLRSYEMIVDQEDILLLFGHRAIISVKDKKYTHKIEFPDVAQLDTGFGDEEEIRIAEEKLNKLKEALNSGVIQELNQINNSIQQKLNNQIIHEDTLPEINTSQILQLESTLRKKGIKEWTGNCKDGKTFKITIEPEKSNTDINLTFSELYGLKMAMDTLRVEELQIVYKSSSHNRKNTS